MISRISKLLVVVACVTFMFTACSKKYSSDDSLTPQYSPSVFIGSNTGILYAYNPSTGVKNWELSLGNSIWASPLTYRGRLYVGVVNLTSPSGGVCDTLYKIDPKTGKIVKRMTVYGASPYTFGFRATPIADGKLIYLATTGDSLFAIDTGTGAVAWRAGTDVSSMISSPVIFGDQIYVATTGGTVYAFDKNTGALAWNNPAIPGRKFESSPAINDSLLFVGSTDDSALYCINLRKAPGYTPGATKWVHKTHGAVKSSPAAIAGRVIFGANDNNVYSVDETTNLENWAPFHTLTKDVVSSPVISADKKLIYIGGTDHILYAINVADGKVNWTYPTNGAITSSPLAYKSTIFIGSYDKVLYAIDEQSHSLKWITTVGGDIDCSPAVEDYSNVQHNSQISGYVNGATY